MNATSRLIVMMSVGLVWALLASGCTATAPMTQSERDMLHEEVVAARDGFVRRDPSIETRFDEAYGYALFPAIGKAGAFIGGGALGWGEVYEQGELIGYARLMSGTLGPQLGGESYSQVIFFENEFVLEDFTMDEFTLAAQVSAVAARQNASLDAMYDEHGLLVFTMTRGGLMAEVSAGGQEFEFVPLGLMKARGQ